MFRVTSLRELDSLHLQFPVLVKSRYTAGQGLEREVADTATLRLIVLEIVSGDVPALIFSCPKTLGGLLKDLANDTGARSDMLSRTDHPHFSKIVAFGDTALRYILVKMAAEEIHWEYFPLLRELTGANPVPPEHAGYVDAMANDWLVWAKENDKLDPIAEVLLSWKQIDNVLKT